MRTLLAAVALALAVAACGPPAEGEPEDRVPKLSAIIVDVFEPRCSATVCHGGSSPSADLSLTDSVHAELVGVDSFMNPGTARVTAGDPEASLLYLALLDDVDNVPRMPRNGPKLDQIDIDQIKQWIEDGAEDN